MTENLIPQGHLVKTRFLGVRGSVPRPPTVWETRERGRRLLTDFIEFGPQVNNIGRFLENEARWKVEGFGGNTTCSEVRTSQFQFLIDGGSGLKQAGEELMAGPCGKGKGEVHILMTHFHLDHLIGIPFFRPIFVPGNKVHFYAVQDELESSIRAIFHRPLFPVEFTDLGAKITFNKMAPRKPMTLGDMTITPYLLDHPDPSWGYRITDGKKNIAYCVDTECTRFTREQLGPDLPLYQNTDLMIFDGQYSVGEVIDKLNWGHSVPSVGLDLAMREGIKRVAFVHHDPFATDEDLVENERQTRQYYEQRLKSADKTQETLHEVHWEFAYEGLEIEL